MHPIESRSDWEPKSLEEAEILYDVAHARSGDKSDKLNIAVFPFDETIYDDLVEILTAERVENHFGNYVKGDVDRYLIPKQYGMNFVLHEALGGGATKSLRHDRTGKTSSRFMLQFPLE